MKVNCDARTTAGNQASYPAPVPPGLVRRARLVERLDAGSTGKVTLVSAPAGFGKTTLLSEWAQGKGSGITGTRMRFSWLSLDRDDNDPDRFWAYFIASLQSIPADLGESCLTLLQARRAPSMKALLARLINTRLPLGEAHFLCQVPDLAGLACSSWSNPGLWHSFCLPPNLPFGR